MFASGSGVSVSFVYGFGGRGSSELSACRSLLGGALTVNLIDGLLDELGEGLGRWIVAFRERLFERWLVPLALDLVGGILGVLDVWSMMEG